MAESLTMDNVGVASFVDFQKRRESCLYDGIPASIDFEVAT